MLDDASYREWTSEFNEGSYFEGSWELGSEIRFLGPNDGESADGMIATVAENRPHEYLSLEYTGQIVDGVDDTTSATAKELAGSHENYSFSESGSVTTLSVDVDSAEEYADMMDEAWPKALATLKAIAER